MGRAGLGGTVGDKGFVIFSLNRIIAAKVRVKAAKAHVVSSSWPYLNFTVTHFPGLRNLFAKDQQAVCLEATVLRRPLLAQSVSELNVSHDRLSATFSNGPVQGVGSEQDTGKFECAWAWNSVLAFGCTG